MLTFDRNISYIGLILGPITSIVSIANLALIHIERERRNYELSKHSTLRETGNTGDEF